MNFFGTYSKKICCKVKKAAKTFAPPDMQNPTYNKKIARGGNKMLPPRTLFFSS